MTPQWISFDATKVTEDQIRQILGDIETENFRYFDNNAALVCFTSTIVECDRLTRLVRAAEAVWIDPDIEERENERVSRFQAYLATLDLSGPIEIPGDTPYYFAP